VIILNLLKEKKMKKRLLALILTTAMLAMGCSGGSKTSESTVADSSSVVETTKAAEGEKSSETSKAEETKAEGTKDAKSVKIGLVTDVGGVNDGSFNQSAWVGLQKIQEEFGAEVKYLQSATDADYAPNLEAFVDDDYDLIISVGYMLADATKEAATAHPDKKFAIVDDSSLADLPNVTCLLFKQEQASYLVGYVAGLMTKTNKVGFVLGMENETMNQFGYGYLAGVVDANKDAKIIQSNANSFSDPAIGKTNANAAITNGADVVFHAAGATGLGVIEACKEAKVYAIGVDSDQASLAPDTVITSAMKRVDNAVYDVSVATIKGELKSGIKVYDLAKGGVDIAPTQNLLSAETIKAVEDVKAKIISGEVVVPATKSEFEAKYGDIYELDK
jgi:hypothetical protein